MKVKAQKSSKFTVKALQTAIRNNDVTEVYKLAKLKGIDVKDASACYAIMNLINEYAPTNKSRIAIKTKMNNKMQRVGGNACERLYIASGKIGKLIQQAKAEKVWSKNAPNYTKILVEGFSNIYWASPVYLHADYNKTIACPNNEFYQGIIQKINKFLGH